MSKEKKRKRTSGPIRDKFRTKAKLINAVGTVLQNKGYGNLNAANIARAAGVDKKLVWTYFGSIDNLIEEYIDLKAFWRLNIPNSIIEKIIGKPTGIGSEEITELLLEYFDTFSKDIDLQKIVHWEMGESKEVLRTIADKREMTGEHIFSLIDSKFENSKTDIRATISLLLGGIYYLNLHANVNGSKVCGLDINEKDDKKRVLKAIEQIIKGCFIDE